ncbi:hypothetical protein TeGR_g15035 [Tetraparma gracilis]|uniref:Glutathione S-transferase n=1 Tax=Tetraparma gracilis TaxID=2962635 RepID=A0ABQ6M839_9STRA|nr:hypothetical protein TeGR_g15035 [Tetraparma gracilis]
MRRYRLLSPFRSCAWLCRIKDLPFEHVKVEPFMGGTRTKEYKDKFPTGLSPAIDDNGFKLAEGGAIMKYLCVKEGWTDFYPTDLQQQALVDQYLSNHHSTTRKMTMKVFHPMMMSFMGKQEWDADAGAKAKDTSVFIASKFQDVFLKERFIAGGDAPTIADLAAYTEIAQVEQVLGSEYSFEGREDMARLNEWLGEIKGLKAHDDVHRTVSKLGQLFQAKLAGA